MQNHSVTPLTSSHHRNDSQQQQQQQARMEAAGSVGLDPGQSSTGSHGSVESRALLEAPDLGANFASKTATGQGQVLESRHSQPGCSTVLEQQHAASGSGQPPICLLPHSAPLVHTPDSSSSGASPATPHASSQESLLPQLHHTAAAAAAAPSRVLDGHGLYAILPLQPPSHKGSAVFISTAAAAAAAATAAAPAGGPVGVAGEPGPQQQLGLVEQAVLVLEGQVLALSVAAMDREEPHLRGSSDDIGSVSSFEGETPVSATSCDAQPLIWKLAYC